MKLYKQQRLMRLFVMAAMMAVSAKAFAGFGLHRAEDRQVFLEKAGIVPVMPRKTENAYYITREDRAFICAYNRIRVVPNALRKGEEMNDYMDRISLQTQSLYGREDLRLPSGVVITFISEAAPPQKMHTGTSVKMVGQKFILRPDRPAHIIVP